SAGDGVGGVVSLQSGSTLAFDTSFSYEGPISIAGAADFSVAAGQTATVAFPIVDSVAQAGELVKTGAGTLVLSALDGPEFYHGGTVIDAGTLEIGAGNVVPGNATFGSTGATLRLDSGIDQIGGGEIIGAAAGDAIDLGFVAFAAGDQAVWQQ